METLYQWRVQEQDQRGRWRWRWRLAKAPMTEETARFWAANNNRMIERIDGPVALRRQLPRVASTVRYTAKSR